jgi:hypothetical protein
LVWFCLAAGPIAAPTVAAESSDVPGGEALVFGNGTYPGLPPLPACLASAHAVAAALHRLGFAGVEQEDASAGVMDAALAQFTRQVQQHAAPPAIIYACGYGTSFNDRPFLLPISASISRPADVLTQGVLARSLVDAAAQGKAGPTVALLDVVPLPKGAEPALGALAQAALPPQVGLLAVTGQPAGSVPTPMAAALIEALKMAPPLRTDALLQAVHAAVAAQSSVHVAAQHLPQSPGALIAAPPAPAPVAAPPAAAASPVPTASAPVVPAPTLPDEAHMTEQDRRHVQQALAQLGYYDGAIDGVFGPDTRAAIRRWQHELHAPMTGHLSAADAARLVKS